MWKFDSVRAKLPGVLKAAGIAFNDDKQAEACVTAVAALMPESEMYTREETQGEVHTAREEARSMREASTALLEKVTGMRRDQFAEQDRTKLMMTAAEERLATMSAENKNLKDSFEPLKKRLTEYESAEAEQVKGKHGEVMKSIEAVFAVPENKTKYGSKFKVPEAGKELSVADMKANVEAFTDLRTLGVPAFQDTKQKPENTPPPGCVAGASPNRRLTAKELADKRRALGIH